MGQKTSKVQRLFRDEPLAAMPSKTERIIEALKALLVTIPDAKVERNTVVPEKVYYSAPAA